MQRTLETTEQGRVIHTMNGVDTRTRAVYVRELKDYTPLPNGFNKELADDVLGQIARTPLLWDQGTWRVPLNRDALAPYQPGDAEVSAQHVGVSNGAINLFHERQQRYPVLADLKEALSEYTDQGRCGTAMCFAGWVAELSGADYALDAAVLTLIQTPLPDEPHERSREVARREHLLNLDPTYVLVSWAQAEELGFPSPMDMNGVFSPEVLALLAGRGFTSATHGVTSVSEYATAQLGLTEYGDGLGLFGADNTYDVLEARVAQYAQDGPGAAIEEDDDEEESA